MLPEAKDLIHQQPLGQLMRYEDHGYFAFERVDRGGKVLGGLLVEV